MEAGALGMIVIVGYLVWTGRMGGGPALTFPWRWKDFRRFSMNWRFVKEDWITATLVVMVVTLISAGSLIAGGLFALGAFVSHTLIHLRTVAELVPTQTVKDGEAESTMRSVYLSIIKRWHPDHATDSADFFRRNHISMLANSAFEHRDLARLQDLNGLKNGLE